MKATIITRLFSVLVLISITQSLWAQPKMLWEKTFGSYNLYNFGISQMTSDNGIVYKGFKTSGLYTENPWIWKYDSDGNYQWDKIYGEEYKGEAKSIKQTPDGGYILAGRVQISDYNYNLWVLKLDANGDSIWSRKYSDAHSTTGSDIVANPDGTCIIVGQSEMPDYFNNNLMILKINALGDTLWTKKYKNSLSYSCSSLIRCSQGGYAAISVIDSTYEAALYFQIIRFDENGDTIWTKKPPLNSMFTSISETSDLGFIVTGGEYNGSGYDLLLLKTNSKGEKEWSKSFEGSGDGVKQTNDGGFIISGYKLVPASGDNYDAWLIKTDKLGNKIWSETFGGTENNERALQVFVTSDNGYYVTGNVKHLFWVARFETDTLKGESTDVTNLNTSTLILNQNYPNPFSSTTSIEYELPNCSKVIISVFNMLGEDIIHLADQTLPAGKHVVLWNGEDRQGNKVTPGTYFYQMITEDNKTKAVTRVSKKLMFYK
jgi:hypothetical protein